MISKLPEGALIGILDSSSPWFHVRVIRTRQDGYVLGAQIHTKAPVAPSATQTAMASPRREPRDSSSVRLRPSSEASGSSYSASAEQAQAKSNPPLLPPGSERNWDVTLWGGFTDVDGSQITLGGNFGYYPFANPALELDADLTYSPGDVDVTSLLGSFTYNFGLNSTKLIPYASAGFGYSRASVDLGGIGVSSSATDFQGGVGVKFPMKEGRLLRIDFRFIEMTRILAGISF